MRYTAHYFRFHNSGFEDFDSLAEAANFLLQGEYNDTLSSESISDEDGNILWDNGTLDSLRELIEQGEPDGK